jgi:hypothetical protein
MLNAYDQLWSRQCSSCNSTCRSLFDMPRIALRRVDEMRGSTLILKYINRALLSYVSLATQHHTPNYHHASPDRGSLGCSPTLFLDARYSCDNCDIFFYILFEAVQSTSPAFGSLIYDVTRTPLIIGFDTPQQLSQWRRPCLDNFMEISTKNKR